MEDRLSCHGSSVLGIEVHVAEELGYRLGLHGTPASPFQSSLQARGVARRSKQVSRLRDAAQLVCRDQRDILGPAALDDHDIVIGPTRSHSEAKRARACV